MKKLFIIFLFIPTLMVGQIRFDLGVDGGICFSNPQINYENTTLYNLYEYVLLFIPEDQKADYTFERFKEVYNINDVFSNPVFGVDGEVWSEKIPIFVGGGISTSPSSLQKPRYRISAGVRKDFYFGNAWMAQAKASYNYMIDRGLGSKTLISAIGNDDARGYAETFFKSKPVPQTGYLISFSPSILKDFGSFSVGLNCFYNLDTTDRLKNGVMRMNNFGTNIRIVMEL